MIIATAELKLTRPNIFTKLPDFTTRTAEYDIATAQFSPLPVFFSYPRSAVTAGGSFYYTTETVCAGLFILYRYNLQQRGYSTLMNDTCIMRGIF